MACERNRSLELIKYIESSGISVNIGKNKARGNKGFFQEKRGRFRIDISKDVDEDSKLSTLLHEYAHYIHYIYDKSLKTLDFVWNNITEDEYDELLSITVMNVPQKFAASLYKLKEFYINENKRFVENIKKEYPDFKISQNHCSFECCFKPPLNYLLKYDRILYNKKKYDLKNLEFDFKELSCAQISYIRFKSNRRKISKINSKINRLNRYYNQPTELWARYFEVFFTNKFAAIQTAPNLTKKFEILIENNSIPEITNVNSIINKR